MIHLFYNITAYFIINTEVHFKYNNNNEKDVLKAITEREDGSKIRISYYFYNRNYG